MIFTESDAKSTNPYWHIFLHLYKCRPTGKQNHAVTRKMSLSMEFHFHWPKGHVLKALAFRQTFGHFPKPYKIVVENRKYTNIYFYY